VWAVFWWRAENGDSAVVEGLIDEVVTGPAVFLVGRLAHQVGLSQFYRLFSKSS